MAAVVMAAGRGSRMRSGLHKPLHRLAGAPMLAYVVDALSECRPDRIVVVVGPNDEPVVKEMQPRTAHLPLEWAIQPTARGTGNAAEVGLEALGHCEDPEAALVIILPGDAPLLRPATLRRLVESHTAGGADCTVLTAHLDDPSGYGRVVRSDDGSVSAIVEHADATAAERTIGEVATSVDVVRRGYLGPALRRIGTANAAGEVYLTDIVGVLAGMGHRVGAFAAADADEVRGVNDQTQLSAARAEICQRVIQRWMAEGVTVVDPECTYVDVTVRLSPGVVLKPGTMLEGATVVGAGAIIGPHTRLVDCAVGADAVVEMSQGIEAEVAPGTHVGPFAALCAAGNDSAERGANRKGPDQCR